MDLRDRRYAVLLVSASEKTTSSLKALLPESLYSPVAEAHDIQSARRALLENTYDIVIINTPFKDDFGTSLALNICDGSGSGVLLLVKAEHYAYVNARVAPYGVLVVSKPTNAQIFSQSLRLLCGTRERLRRMEQKTASIEEKMRDIRIINRAKWLLIENLKMSEETAHRYIEKQAMDRCVTKRTIAESIISTYNK